MNTFYFSAGSGSESSKSAGSGSAKNECEPDTPVGRYRSLLSYLLDTVLILVLLLPHEVAHDVEPVPEGLGRVQLPPEHGQRLEGERQVQQARAAVDHLVVCT